MHPINRVLSLFGLQLSRIALNANHLDDQEREFRRSYESQYKLVENNKLGFKVIGAYRYQTGNHPFRMQDLEFEFTSYHVYRTNPESIMDIGSYRHFILGLLAHYNVTSIDIRERKSMLENEDIVTCDAKELDFPDNSFDSVISLEALPHFGLCRYGDDFDLDADVKVFNEMIRVLRPEGILIFSTAITGGEPTIAFNARRNYSYEMIRNFCSGLECVDEKLISRQQMRFCSLEELTVIPESFDYYIGCWKKKDR